MIVLRYAEIFLKGGNRSFFEAKLVENAQRVLAGLPARVTRVHGRVLVEVDDAERARAVERLARVFGVQSLSPARVTPPSLEAIGEAAVAAARAQVSERSRPVPARGRDPGGVCSEPTWSEAGGASEPSNRGGRPTFKVETRRADKRFPLRSPEVSRQVGARVVAELGLPVDVHRPQLTIGVEIGAERCFVFAETVPGPGGLPVGASGLVNLLLSGGIDSPVAGWLAMKRGCRLVATYFHSFPFTGDRTREKVVDLCRLLVPWHGPIPLHVVHFTDAQKALRDAGPGELAVVLYRRMMVRAAAELAARAGALALVTGDNLAQVASQTLENLAVVEQASPLPVLRPLLCYDKLETIALAQRIGTYETSILPYEDCCSLFVPTHPATRARLEQVQAVEERLDVAAMTADLAGRAERKVVE